MYRLIQTSRKMRWRIEEAIRRMTFRLYDFPSRAPIFSFQISKSGYTTEVNDWKWQFQPTLSLPHFFILSKSSSLPLSSLPFQNNYISIPSPIFVFETVPEPLFHYITFPFQKSPNFLLIPFQKIIKENQMRRPGMTPTQIELGSQDRSWFQKRLSSIRSRRWRWKAWINGFRESRVQILEWILVEEIRLILIFW